MGSPAVTASDPVREHYAYLMAFARGEPNDDALACMLATRHAGGGALPERLGLTPGEYRGMLAYHFPGALLDGLETQGGLAAARADEAAGPAPAAARRPGGPESLGGLGGRDPGGRLHGQRPPLAGPGALGP